MATRDATGPRAGRAAGYEIRRTFRLERETLDGFVAAPPPMVGYHKLCGAVSVALHRTLVARCALLLERADGDLPEAAAALPPTLRGRKKTCANGKPGYADSDDDDDDDDDDAPPECLIETDETDETDETAGSAGSGGGSAGSADSVVAVVPDAFRTVFGRIRATDLAAARNDQAALLLAETTNDVQYAFASTDGLFGADTPIRNVFAAFPSTMAHFRPLFDRLPWNHMFVAGGNALSVFTDTWPRNGETDVDMWVQSDQAVTVIQTIRAWAMENSLDNLRSIRIVNRTVTKINFFHQKADQVVCIDVISVKPGLKPVDVIRRFDIPTCRVGYVYRDSKLLLLVHRTILDPLVTVCPVCEVLSGGRNRTVERVAKYRQRGYGHLLLVPVLCAGCHNMFVTGDTQPGQTSRGHLVSSSSASFTYLTARMSALDVSEKEAFPSIAVATSPTTGKRFLTRAVIDALGAKLMADYRASAAAGGGVARAARSVERSASFLTAIRAIRAGEIPHGVLTTEGARIVDRYLHPAPRARRRVRVADVVSKVVAGPVGDENCADPLESSDDDDDDDDDDSDNNAAAAAVPRRPPPPRR